MWKYIVDPNRPHDNTAHNLCMHDKYGYRHTLRIRNTYCFSTSTIATRKRLNFTSYVHCCVLLRSSVTTRMILRRYGDTSPKREHRAIPNTKKSRTNKHQKHATNHSDRTLDSHYTVYDSRVTLVTGWRNERALPSHTPQHAPLVVSELRNVLTFHDRIPNNFFAWWLFISILAPHRSLSNVECHVHGTWMSHTGRFSYKERRKFTLLTTRTGRI